MLSVMMATSVASAQVVPPLGANVQRLEAAQQDDGWLDRTHRSVHHVAARAARMIDSWAGPPLDQDVYAQASGSIAAAILWDEFDGFQPRVRFQIDLPLPQVNQRLHLFVGRVNRDEFVTERNEPSGAFPDWRGGVSEEDQTLAGLIYSHPDRHGGSFSAGAGSGVHSAAPDPYVKVAYLRRWVPWDDTLFTAKETLFYQLSEHFGVTTRLDFERMLNPFWRLRWRGSATLAEGSQGVRGYTTLTATRTLPGRRAVVFRIGARGESGAPVPVRDYGVKVAYRQSMLRDWLVMELRTSLSWPRKLPEQPRKPSWGFGIGCEMYFGTDEFSSQPVTF